MYLTPIVHHALRFVLLISRLFGGQFRQGVVLRGQFFSDLSSKIFFIGTNVSLLLTLLDFFQVVDELLVAFDACLFTSMLKLGVIRDLLLVLLTSACSFLYSLS